MNLLIFFQNISIMLAQTKTQKTLTLVNVGCIAACLIITCLDKFVFKNKVTRITILFITVVLTVFFLILYFFAE